MLLALILLLGNTATVFATNEDYARKSIALIYSGKTFYVNVFEDKNGVLYAPIDWMSYFGLYECVETEDSYVFYCAGQEKNHDFAKKIYISRDGKHYVLSYYTDEYGLEKSRYIYLDSDNSKKWLDYLNSTYYGSASYRPILEGNFSNSFFEEETLYLPLAEMLPFFNAKIGVTENLEVYISPNPMSLSQALYDIDIADLAFNASSDIAHSDSRSFFAFILNTFNVFNPRLDYLNPAWGQENDYKAIFREYLIDNETYLSAFDAEETSPVSSALELGKDFTSAEKNALSVVSKVNKTAEYVSGIKKLSLKAPSWSDVCKEYKKVNVSTVFSGAYKIFDYWYHYTNQVDDHRKMLGAVYNYEPVREVYEYVGEPSYKAAVLVQKQYGEDDSERFLAATDTAMKDLGLKALETVYDLTAEAFFTPYASAAYVIASMIPDIKNGIEQLENDAQLYAVDHNAWLSTDVYFERRYSQQYDSESLENLRLCAMHSLVASRHAYISLFDKDYNHPKVKKIEEALIKLYLAADGVECDSSDYYGRKKADLEKELKKIKTTDGWSDNETTVDTTLSSKQITIEEAYRIAKRHCFGNNSNTAGYSFAAESIFEYKGVSYYPIKVSFDLGTHTSYAGLHLFVSLDGKTVLEGTYAYGTNGDDLYEIYEE